MPQAFAFLSSSHRVNLDHAATTAPDPRVITAVAKCMAECDGNPSSVYREAGAARKTIREAKEALAALICAAPQELYITGSGTEANNWAMLQAAGKHIVVSGIEHKSVLLAAKRYAASVTVIPPMEDGTLSPQDIASALRPETALVSVMLANNETGAVQPVAEIGNVTRARGILFHCDGVQAYGHIPIDVNACRIDLFSASAHKLYGPRGVGLLYARNGLSLTPLLLGGRQERNLRAGTENVPGIAGFGAAAGLAAEDMAQRAAREAKLRQLFIERVTGAVPTVRVLACDVPRLPGIAALWLPNPESEAVIAAMDAKGVRISGGAACAAGSASPSHVYMAMGLPADDAKRIVRISFGRNTTEEETLYAAEMLIGTLQATAPEAPAPQ